MRNRVSTAVLLGVIAMALSGCSGMVARSHFSPRVSMAGADMTKPDRMSFTDTGRLHLYAGRTGLAIEALQQALVVGEAPSPAFNGLGIAYARLGRADLAERFFAKAIAAAPDNKIYAENLARLGQSRTLSQRMASGAASPISPPGVKKTPSAIQRIARGEVFIRTQPVNGAAATANQRMAQRAQLPISQFQKVVNIQPRTGNLQRISRAEVRIASTPTTYPVRVQFAGARASSEPAGTVPRPKSRTVMFPAGLAAIAIR